MLGAYLSGIFTMGLVMVALVFLRAWKETADPLFLKFSIAFGLMAIERIPLALFDKMEEPGSFVYLFRLLAFLIILETIYHKSFSKKKRAETRVPRLHRVTDSSSL